MIHNLNHVCPCSKLFGSIFSSYFSFNLSVIISTSVIVVKYLTALMWVVGHLHLGNEIIYFEMNIASKSTSVAVKVWHW